MFWYKKKPAPKKKRALDARSKACSLTTTLGHRNPPPTSHPCFLMVGCSWAKLPSGSRLAPRASLHSMPPMDPTVSTSVWIVHMPKPRWSAWWRSGPRIARVALMVRRSGWWRRLKLLARPVARLWFALALADSLCWPVGWLLGCTRHYAPGAVSPLMGYFEDS